MKFPRLKAHARDQGDYELQNGFDPNNATDATLDFDGDGMTNRQEFLAQTDPKNADSVFAIESIGFSGSNVIVTVRSVPGTQYTLDRSVDLINWGFEADRKTATGPSLALTDTNAASLFNSMAFYRVRVVP